MKLMDKLGLGEMLSSIENGLPSSLLRSDIRLSSMEEAKAKLPQISLLCMPKPKEEAKREANCLWRREEMQNCISSLLECIRGEGREGPGRLGRKEPRRARA
jgi:hypothetical protein